MTKLKLMALGLFLIASITACGKESEKTYTQKELAQMSDEELEDLFERQLEELEEAESETDDNKEKGSLRGKLQDFLNGNSEDKESTTTITESDIPTTAELPDTEAKASHTKTNEANLKILTAQWHSGMIQLDDVVFQLPITVTELTDLGFEYKIYGGESISEDYLYAQGESFSLEFQMNDQSAFSISVRNTLEGFHTAADIVAAQNPVLSSLDTYSVSGAYFPGGLKAGDSFLLIEERLGAPSSIDNDMNYYYGNTNAGCGMTIYIDRNTQTIRSISLKRITPPIELDVTALKTFTYDNYECSYPQSYHNFSINFFPNAVDNNHGSSALLSSLFLFNNELYQCDFNAGVTHKNHVSSSYFDEQLFSETDDNDITKIFFIDGQFSNSYGYTIINDNYALSGRFTLQNLSNTNVAPDFHNEQLQNAIYELVKSIQFNM